MTLYFDLPRTTPITADPSPWRDCRPSPRLAQATVGSGVVAVLLLAAAVWSAIAGDAGAALACGIAVLLLGHLFGLLLNLWVRPHNTGDRMRITRIDDGTPGLTFGYSRRLYYWYSAFLTLLTLAQAALALRTPPLAVGALLSASALYVLLRHAPGRLALTPDGVYHRGIRTEQFVPWQSIREVVPDEQARIPVITLPAAPAASPSATSASATFPSAASPSATFPSATSPSAVSADLSLVALPEGPVPTARVRPSLFRTSDCVTIQIPWLAADPVLVLQTLRWYHANPAHRFELSFQIAVDRARHRTWH
ncbi:hypothetical protein BJY16_004373 [Actinoplanes octamycinicus]|uniref:Uncharacterized protein n=1 Tax=Actinoplanes octamycinicus TaxID=135948 RepID=A0A7W7M8I3_9ACTN|nr:hypothetical protein [Actinoplanes octamycinicus]MBB4740914.1 hypothetical protein [Actinoplanes octamycinicus]GIE55821.1 hypothetical protein Aoc01nite_12230 [Actinoplanes octamycinicus]